MKLLNGAQNGGGGRPERGMEQRVLAASKAIVGREARCNLIPTFFGRDKKRG
jgi:hypothetical protein